MTGLILMSLLSGSGHIACEYKKHYPLIYLLKPLTVALIMVAVYRYSPLNDYSLLILTGLLFSLFGDIFLMLKQQKFIAGLVSFLIAHILYIVAFYTQLDHSPSMIGLFFFAIPALLIYGYLYPGLAKLKIPVLIYVSAIMLMGYFSWAAYLIEPNNFTLAAFAGALVFMISDATLAINKFKAPFKAAQMVILSTYYVAQWGIAYSTLSVS